MANLVESYVRLKKKERYEIIKVTEKEFSISAKVHDKS
jgi:hypothetical protein